jgi:hypothetical protein
MTVVCPRSLAVGVHFFVCARLWKCLWCPQYEWKELQAAGSSLLTRIAHCLVLHALRLAGMKEITQVQVFPVATGMTMTLAFLACAARRPAAKCVSLRDWLCTDTGVVLDPCVYGVAHTRFLGDGFRTECTSVSSRHPLGTFATLRVLLSIFLRPTVCIRARYSPL